jgi:CheY-like chemotaxis protein
MNEISVPAPRILIVDDDDDFRKDVEQRLLDLYPQQHSVPPDIVLADGADTGFAALEQGVGSKKPFDVLLTDLDMPGGTGLDLIRRVQGATWPLKPKVVAFTNKPRGNFTKTAQAMRPQPSVWDKPTSQAGWVALTDELHRLFWLQISDAAVAGLIGPGASVPPSDIMRVTAAYLFVRVDLGPLGTMSEASVDADEARRIKRRGEQLSVAAGDKGGKVILAAGNAFAASFPHADQSTAALLACDAFDAYRQMADVIYPESAGVIVAGLCHEVSSKSGLVGGAHLGAVPGFGLQLLGLAARGRLGYSPSQLGQATATPLASKLRGLRYRPCDPSTSPVQGLSDPVDYTEWSFV